MNKLNKRVMLVCFPRKVIWSAWPGKFLSLVEMGLCMWGLRSTIENSWEMCQSQNSSEPQVVFRCLYSYEKISLREKLMSFYLVNKSLINQTCITEVYICRHQPWISESFLSITTVSLQSCNSFITVSLNTFKLKT